MKKIFFLIAFASIFLMLTCSNSANDMPSNLPVSLPPPIIHSFDTIPCEEVLLNGKLKMLSNKRQLIAVLGYPDSSSSYIDEESGYRKQALNYGQNVLCLYPKRMTSIVIADSSLSLMRYNIRVGQSVDSLAAIFPNSYRHPSMEEFKSLDIDFLPCGKSNIGYIGISFDTNRRISRIVIGFLE